MQDGAQHTHHVRQQQGWAQQAQDTQQKSDEAQHAQLGPDGAHQQPERGPMMVPCGQSTLMGMTSPVALTLQPSHSVPTHASTQQQQQISTGQGQGQGVVQRVAGWQAGDMRVFSAAQQAMVSLQVTLLCCIFLNCQIRLHSAVGTCRGGKAVGGEMASISSITPCCLCLHTPAASVEQKHSLCAVSHVCPHIITLLCCVSLCVLMSHKLALLHAGAEC